MTVDPLAVTVTVRVEGAGSQLVVPLAITHSQVVALQLPVALPTLRIALGEVRSVGDPAGPLFPGVTLTVGTLQSVTLLRVTRMVTATWMSSWLPLVLHVGRGGT